MSTFEDYQGLDLEETVGIIEEDQANFEIPNPNPAGYINSMNIPQEICRQRVTQKMRLPVYVFSPLLFSKKNVSTVLLFLGKMQQRIERRLSVVET